MRLAAVLVVAAACGSDNSLPMPAHCNPLGANHCTVPFPSSVFEVADSTSMTGRRLAIPLGALPPNGDGDPIDPTAWNQADGWSPAAPIIMSFPKGVSSDGLVGPLDMTASTTPDSATALLDMTTGQLVAHWAEIDSQVKDPTQGGSQALFIRAAARLVGGHRYAVAITNRVKAADGSALTAPPGFAAVRDNTKTDNKLLEADRARLGEALAALDTAGFPKTELVLAWDFTVASDDFLHREMIAARDRTLAALQSHPIGFTIITDQPIDTGTVIKRRISGTLDAPLFLTNGGSAAAYPEVARDADGLPALQGFYQIPFTAIVPACAYTASAPVGMIMYGHGLLGDSGEAADGTQQTTTATLCMVTVGTDMRGMSQIDTAAVARTLNDATHAGEVFEVLEQGLANHVTLAQAMRTTFATQLFVDAANGNRSLVDPTKVYYYGLSQGGIFGTSVMAYEPTITRGVLGVGGANYSLLLDRSIDWQNDYRLILQGSYPDPLDDELVISLCQMRWDKTEPSGISNSVLAGTATNVPPKQIIMQVALADEQVPNLGSWWQARTMGIPVLGPTPMTPWGLQVSTTPTNGAIVIMDGGAPPPPVTNLPPAMNLQMHDLTRIQAASRRQMAEFYASGTIVNECSGACTCQTGACN